jgi:hypothetical protein
LSPDKILSFANSHRTPYALFFSVLSCFLAAMNGSSNATTTSSGGTTNGSHANGLDGAANGSSDESNGAAIGSSSTNADTAASSARPVLVMTHPRSCSTAFSRVFITQRDSLEYFHETLSDAYWFGPERTAERTRDDDVETRARSGLQNVTYAHVLEQFAAAAARGKRPFIKDMAYSIVPPHPLHGNVDSGGERVAVAATVAPSLGGPEADNITLLPLKVLRQFQWVFLIRNPRRAIPSLCRCMTPPLSETTGFEGLLRSDVGIEPLRELLDFVVARGIVARGDVVVLDADGLLDRPADTVRGLCARIGVPFDEARMLEWTPADRAFAEKEFEKWKGWHDDALGSDCLRARDDKKKKKDLSADEEDAAWRETYGEDMAALIRKYVDENMHHYEHMRQYAFNV